MNPDPDYSAAYSIIRTDAGDGLEGHGFAFTIGRGNDVQVAAIRALEPFVVGLPVERPWPRGTCWRSLVHDSQLRWLGPEKGVMHMAISAVINALWDLAAKRAGKPLWKLLAEMSPEALVALVDFRYLTDALTPDEALAILRRAQDGRAERTERLLDGGYPAYTTTPGWLGYSDAKLARLCQEAVQAGYDQVKLKVGAQPRGRRPAHAHRARGVRRRRPRSPSTPTSAGTSRRPCAGSGRSSRMTRGGSRSRPAPTTCSGTPPSGAGSRPVRIATGEHVQNRVVFKQLMQAEAIDIVQIDAARVAGVNENLAILLLAAKFGLPVCPHAGGVGLCELVQHLAMFDYIAVSGTLEDRVIEYVDHLHEHFVDPVVVRDGRYRAPVAPGMSAELTSDALTAHLFPGGAAWVEPALQV